MKEIITTYEQLLEKLEQMITKMESMHTPSLSFGTGILMHQNEIHTVQAIGRHSRINVTNLAKYKGVTKGAISQTIKRLIKKGLVRRTHAPGNAKEVLLELTDLGWIGFHNHEKFHMDTLDIAREYFGDQLKSRLERISLAADDLNEILNAYEKKRKND